MVRIADLLDPERHHLHVAARVGAGHCVLAEIAFVLDQASTSCGSRPARVASYCTVIRKSRRVGQSGIFGRKPRRHVLQPRLAFGFGREDQLGAGKVADRAMQQPARSPTALPRPALPRRAVAGSEPAIRRASADGRRGRRDRMPGRRRSQSAAGANDATISVERHCRRLGIAPRPDTRPCPP